MISPTEIWSWFQGRKNWQKWILFAFIIIAIALVFVFRSAFAAGGDDALVIFKEKVEARNKERLKEAVEQDKKFIEEIKEERKTRENERNRREEIKNETEDLHDRIDSADDFDDVFDVIRDASSR